MRRWTGMAAGAVLCLLAGCGPGLGVTTPVENGGCRKVAGSYVSSYGNSCGRFSNGDAATITQSGCTFTCALAGVGTLTGTIGEEDAVDWKVEFGGDCKGTGTGVGRIDGTRITGTYAGVQAGSGCCTTVTGTFTLYPKASAARP